MLTKIDYLWRLFGTAISYFVFGAAGVIVPIALVPVLYCLPGSERVRIRRAQRSIQWLLQVYVAMMRLLGVLTYQVDGIEKLKHAKLILANHPSLLDVVFLISMVPNANCIVKGGLARNFFTRGTIRVAGYIVNEEAGDLISAAARVINDGQALIIFPEGTRTTPSGELRFKRGAANIAIRTRSDITPVLIYCKPTTLTKYEHWYRVPDKRVHFTIRVGDDMAVDRYVENEYPSRAARDLNSELITYFNRELEMHG